MVVDVIYIFTTHSTLADGMSLLHYYSSSIHSATRQSFASEAVANARRHHQPLDTFLNTKIFRFSAIRIHLSAQCTIATIAFMLDAMCICVCVMCIRLDAATLNLVLHVHIFTSCNDRDKSSSDKKKTNMLLDATINTLPPDERTNERLHCPILIIRFHNHVNHTQHSPPLKSQKKRIKNKKRKKMLCAFPCK